jgi:hypothetical protein
MISKRLEFTYIHNEEMQKGAHLFWGFFWCCAGAKAGERRTYGLTKDDRTRSAPRRSEQVGDHVNLAPKFLSTLYRRCELKASKCSFVIIML